MRRRSSARISRRSTRAGRSRGRSSGGHPERLRDPWSRRVIIASSFEIAQPRERVFAALVDPAVLQRCIPGCESLTATGPDQYEARLRIGVAGLKGSYTGKAELRDKHPPESFTLAFDGKGGPGFVRGTAKIRLTPIRLTPTP